MRSGAHGFALLELLIVLALGTLLTVAAIWQVRPLADRLTLQGAATHLLGEIREAQARALAERDPGRAYGIEFPPDGQRYITFVQAGGVRSLRREERLHQRVRITYARFGGVPSAVVFTGVSFLGAPSGGGTVSLSAGGALLCVRVQPATGRARIENAGCP
ncbi:MAG TPA: prepilin-type N-terminal cleavage/methylation domain-containing protein [bacterium]